MGGLAKLISDRQRPPWLPVEGEVIADRYRLEVLLGAGGMGAVMAAFDIKLAQRVAVKFLDPGVAHEPDQIRRFLNEAQATTRVRTEHVVRVLDVGATNQGLNFIVMERLDGADLAEHVRNGPLPVQLAVDCVLQASEALSEAHAAGIVHRDIKPSNLWLSQRSDGSPLLKILDFGISKLVPTNESDAPKLTDTHAVFGSPAYMSPEQIRSAKNVDAGTDVWALGVVLHELLTARMPFEGESVAAVLAGIAADPPTPLEVQRPDAPVDVAEAVRACLEKDRSRRISLRELAARLRPYASLAGVVAANRLQGPSLPVHVLVPPPARPSSAPVVHAVTLGDTDLELATTRLSHGIGSARLRAWTAAGLAVFAVLGFAAFGMRRIVRHGSEAPRAAAETAPATVTALAPSPTIAPSASAAPALAPSESSARPAVAPSTNPGVPRKPRSSGASPVKATASAPAAPTATSTTSPTRE